MKHYQNAILGENMRKAIAVAMAAIFLFSVSASPADARGHHRGGHHRVHYGGGHHTHSHGGHYAGGHGSSHKGGHYRNKRTHNHYGTHK
jgi:hypothetical protein